MSADDTPTAAPSTSYRVLARKYRPKSFDDLIGQDAMIRVLSAAFQTGRIPHAFMLTGVRGVGKTTTARLLARALNYVDAEGHAAPTLDLSTPGLHCPAIMQSRHMDVLEMDAASRTGIDDIREIIEDSGFRPASAPYKVYIIDEVHMLSKNAFNGLLKLLEEPPEHVKFIFATTEVRKIPVTVLSRCQRFDLRRIEPELMVTHLTEIAEKEGVEIAVEALGLIARASEGSVRDALSLLDQAIARGSAEGKRITEQVVRDMMGLADRERVLDLLDHVLAGNIAAALEEMRAQYDLGADPLDILRDLLELTHWLTRFQVTGTAPADAAMSQAKVERSAAMAKQVPMSALSRTWQILLKGLAEAQQAPRPLDAVEMVLVRLGYSANLPTPEDLVRRLTARPADQAAPSSEETGPTAAPPSPPTGALGTPERASWPPAGSPARGAAAPHQATAPQPRLQAHIGTFQDILELAQKQKDIRLLTELEDCVHPVHVEPGRFEFRPSADAPEDLAGRLAQKLSEWTGQRWIVSLSSDMGEDTVSGQRKRRRSQQEAELRKHPLIQAAFRHFPEAKIIDIRSHQAPIPDSPDSPDFLDGEDIPDLEDI